MSTVDSVRTIAEPLVAARGFQLYDLEQHGPVLRVTVAAALGGQNPGVDELGVLSKELSRALDEADPISGRYTLEVSSPGLERKLRTPEHFRGAVGETVSVKVRESGQPARRVRGVVVSADDESVTIRPDAPPADRGSDDTQGDDEATSPLRLDFAVVDSARTVFEWGMTPPERDPEPNPSVPSQGSTRRSDR